MSNKLVGILGASFVGKSHIVHILTNKPNISYRAHVTIGCNISKYNYNNIDYSLCDIYPQFSYIKTAHSWLQKFDMCIFICDATDYSSIKIALDFYNELKPKKYAILINKTDLINRQDKEKFLEKIHNKFKDYILVDFITINKRDKLITSFNNILDNIN